MRQGVDDAALSDIAGTLLLVLAVVLVGGGVAAVVATNLQVAATPAASIGVTQPEPGDATLRLALRNGQGLALDEIQIRLLRDGVATDVPRSSWTSPNAARWSAGETIEIPLSPVAAAGEPLRVLVVHPESNGIVADLAATAPSPPAPLPASALTATLTPGSIIADASTAALLAVRVAHPMGALGIASVTADLSAIAAASGTASEALALRDDGEAGDSHGGDGLYSALVRAPINATPGSYAIPVQARDVSGAIIDATPVTLTITANLTDLVGGFTGSGVTSGQVASISAALANLSALGNLTQLLANLTGAVPGVVVLNSTAAGEGTRLSAPTSENLSSFHIVNWSWDRANPSTLYQDAAVVRMMSGGYAWSAYVKFGYVASTPSIIQLEMWNANSTAGRTVYTPSNGQYVSLVGLSLNMTHPTESGFVCSLRCATPMTYKAADIRGHPTFSIAYMRDEGNNPDTADLGIFSMEAILR